MKFNGQSFWANKVTLGAFTLPRSLSSKLNGYEPVTMDSAFLQALPFVYRNSAQILDGWCYFSDPHSPKIGDVRLRFEVIRPGPASVVSKQVGNTFEPYMASSGKNIQLIEPAVLSADNMVNAARQENIGIAWALRFGGVLLVFIGGFLILRPISVLLDVLPFLGSIAGIGIGVTAFMAAIIISSAVIAVAWFSYRPLLSIGIIISAIVAVVLMRLARRQKAVADRT